MQYMARQRYFLYQLLLGLPKSLLKPKDFLFSGGIEKQQQAVMG